MMRTKVRLILVAMGATLVSTQTRGSVLRAEGTTERLNEYLSACESVLDFSGAVLVRHEGKVLVSRGIGWANLEHQVANTPQTKFRIGSITKSFTALLVLQQVQAGKLALDDPVSKHLDSTPEAWAPITIHHLLSHTSGIFNFTDSLDYLTKRAVLGKPEKVLGMFRDKPLRFAPGEKHEYSNSGYLLLGMILEKVGGRDYAELMREQVFEPLEMHDSGYDLAATIVPRRAQGYSGHGKSPRNAAYVDMRGVQAAGALYSTVEDLAKYDAALTAGKLISAELYEKLYTPVKDNYAYGWVVETQGDRRVIWHNGGIDGFTANLTRCPERKTAVTVLSNFDDGLPDRMTREIMSLLFGEEYRLPREHAAVAIDAAGYDALVGSYRLGPGAILKVLRKGDRLYTQLTGQPQVEVFPESENEFFLKAVDAQLSFARDAEGLVVQVTLHQGGRHVAAPRIDEAAGETAK